MTSAGEDVLVAGGGPAGMLAALLVARTGASVVLIAPPPRPDSRTTALLDGSVAILRDAGLWPAVADAAAPLRKLRLVDGGQRLVRTPEVTFAAAELGLDAFGWNVPNAALLEALAGALAREPGVRRIDAEVTEATAGQDAVHVTASDGAAFAAPLAIAAEGRRSPLRAAAGIDLPLKRLPQTALAFVVAHTLDHGDVSTEFHHEEGPFTLVPMPGRRSSVVWVVTPERAERLLALDPESLGEAVTRRAGRLLGAMTPEGRVGTFPIETGSVACFAAKRVLLVGETAHVLPPIGAQGLNLGVRDAAASARVVAEARAERRDLGAAATLRAYAHHRAVDVWPRTAATDLLNRSLITGLTPAHAARGAGLAALSAFGPLRRFVMRQGLGAG